MTVLQRIRFFLTTVAAATVLAALYGIVHDQVTYTLCAEYYTRFKFIQFGFISPGEATVLPTPRLYVVLVGIGATWWVGAFVGLCQAGAALLLWRTLPPTRVVRNAILLTLLTTLVAGGTGFFYGRFHLALTGVSWWLPDHLVDRAGFITVGSIHNFGYLGGVLGLVVGIGYQWRARYLEHRAPRGL